jgi:hypothetical protein
MQRDVVVYVPNWIYCTLAILDYTLMRRYRQISQCIVHYKRSESPWSSDPHQSSRTGFHLRNFLCSVSEISPRFSHRNSCLTVHSTLKMFWKSLVLLLLVAMSSSYLMSVCLMSNLFLPVPYCYVCTAITI